MTTEPDEDHASVLVVEDTDDLRRLIVLALEQGGHSVTAVPDGTSALAAAFSNPPDVVLLDLGLPDRDGLTVLDALKGDPRTGDAPVIVVTARGGAETASQALRRGAHDHVGKPFRIPELLARVGAAVRVKREHDALSLARHALSSQRDFTEAVLDTLDAIVVVLDPAGRIVRFNRAAERLSGWLEDEVSGRDFWSLFTAPSESEALREAHRNQMSDPAGQASGRSEAPICTRDGRWLVISWSDTALLDHAGRLAFGVRTGVDVTAVRSADERLRLCLDVMPDGISILDPVRSPTGEIEAFTLSYLNPAGRGFDPDAVVGETAGLCGRPLPRDLLADLVTVACDGGHARRRVEVSLGSRVMTLEISASRLDDGLVLAYRDVTDLQAAQIRLAWAATHDPLTGLANRPMLIDRLTMALARRRLSTDPVITVVFIDLDGFKQFNDDFGHTVGDEVLVEVAHRLAAAVRPTDTVARFGGDEFVVVADDLPSEAKASELAARLSEAVVMETHGRFLRASVGMAMAMPGDTPESLLKQADQVMYMQKRELR